MKEILFIAISLLALAFHCSAQNLQWANTLGGSGTDRPQHIETDSEGNIYVAGTFINFAAFSDSEIELNGESGIDIYLYKRNPAGELLWARVISGYGEDRIYDMAIDTDDNVFLVGDFLNAIEFESAGNSITIVSAGQRDGFIVKYSSAGTVLAAYPLGGAADHDDITNIAFDNENNIILMGRCDEDTDFDFSSETVQFVVANRRFFVLKLNPEFEFISVFKIRGSQIRATSVVITDQNDVIFSGTFGGDILFGEEYPFPGLTTNSGADAGFIIKMTPDGEYTWGSKIDGYPFEYIADMMLSPDGDIILSGEFKGETIIYTTDTFHTLQSNGSAKDIFFLKLSQAGALEWIKTIGGAGIDEVGGIEIDSYGNLISAGTYSETIDFDPSMANTELTPLGNSASYIARYSANGDFIDVNTFQNTSYNSASGIALNGNDEIYLSGWFTDSIDLSLMEPGYAFSSAGNSDTYLLKMDAHTVDLNNHFAEHEIGIYPNPANSIIQIKTTGVQSVEIYDVYGRLVTANINNSVSEVRSINVSQLPTGTYFLRLSADGGFVRSEKFMIMR